MAGSRPVSFLPDSSSAFDKHTGGGGRGGSGGGGEEGKGPGSSLGSLLLLGYPRTVIS